MMSVHQPNTEPLPGYRLLEPLGRGGYGEVWKCEAPGGLVKAIKFVPGQTRELGDDENGAAQELRALQHIKSIRHPFLLSMDRVELIDGDLLIVMELADRSLHDLLEQYRANGRPGIPRGELIGYMFEAAEVLDLMNQEHQLQHLDIKPRNLFLVGRHVKVADFGLVNSSAEMTGPQPSSLHLGAITPTYAAPESFVGKISSTSDQYSLAVAYFELLTGNIPFTGKNFRQLAMQHMQVAPDLSALPENDRPAVARALAKNPQERFPSCGSFVQALYVGMPGGTETRVPAQTFFALDIASQTTKPLSASGLKPGSMSSSGSGVTTTVTRPAASSSQSPMEFAGIQLLECLNRQFGGELWRARTKDSRKRLVRFLFGVDEAQADGDPIARLTQFKHGGLAKMEVVRDGPNRVGLVMDVGEEHLGVRLKECMQAGQPGIPRGELLDGLASVAAALDDLYDDHSVPHLTLSPRTVALMNGKARLLDFGLAALFWLSSGQQPGMLNTRYAAPELFDGKITKYADQYSLALIFQEMLTGVHAFRNLNARQLVNPRQRGTPDLGMLGAADRAIVLRALHQDPERRFGSCSEFIETLSDAAVAPKTSSPSTSRLAVPVMPTKAITPLGNPPVAVIAPTRSSVVKMLTPVTSTPVVATANPAVEELLAMASAGQEVRERGPLRFLIKPGRALVHHCGAHLIAAMVRLRLYRFLDHWKATLVERKREGHYRFLVPLPGGNMWQRVMGRQPQLAVEIHCAFPQNEGTGLTMMEIEIRPEGCGESEAVSILEKVGPAVLESLWGCLDARPERRGQLRLPFEQIVRVAPLFDGKLGDAIEGKTRDVSSQGMSVILPKRLPSAQVSVLVALPSRREPASISARVAHVRNDQDGRFEVGLAFV
jgi:serine/threonine protein kinase